MQLICDYRAEPPIVVGHVPDAVTVDMADDTLSAFVLVPYAGDLAALGRVGPEPQLMGDPPTESHPDHAELDAAGVAHDHPLRALAGTPYPDNRRLAEDLRPYAAPPQSDPDVQRAYLAHLRWTVETGGIDVDGFPATTRRDARGQTEADAGRAARDPTFKKRVKASDGNYHDLDAAALVKVADRTSDHVEACFALEAKLRDAIAAGKIKGFAALDGAFAAL